MTDLIRKSDIYKELEFWDCMGVYFPTHFKELVDDIPTVQGGYTEQDVRDAFTDGFSRGIQRGYEDAVRNYKDLVLKLCKEEKTDE